MTNPNGRPSPVGSAFTLARLDAHVLRWPVRQPVQTSFGTMHDRPAVLVRVEDADGAVGWGEIWCNFPSCGAEHRARLLETVLAPLLVGKSFATAEAAFADLTARTAVLAIQSGEPGPMAQAIAGVDLALWDMLALRAGMPLWQFLGGSADKVRIYASGINPDRPVDVMLAKHAQGYRAFKLKVGFGEARDIDNVAAMQAQLPADCELMVDANQAWDLEHATRMAGHWRDVGLTWLEEPLRADRPVAEWVRLAEQTDIALAAGENLIGRDAFDRMITSKALKVVQPDLAKWGGISGCMAVIAQIHSAGQRYCPHFLGAGIGQLASAHVLAALGAVGGMLEIDSNENPLRTALSPVLNAIVDGAVSLGHAPGLGVEPNIADLRTLCASR